MSGSHLRWSVYEDFVNKVYPQLDEKERENIYTYAKRDLSWHFEGDYVDETAREYFRHLLARFSPANQYNVDLIYDGKKHIVKDAYLWEDKYYVDWCKYCASEYIIAVHQRPFAKCNNLACKSVDKCLRTRMYDDAETTSEKDYLKQGAYPCDKCDFFISIKDD